MKKIIFAFFCMHILILIGCEEQKVDIEKFGNLQGTILDGENYAPIEGVLITTNPASSSALTNSAGSFSIAKVKEGDITVTAHKKDYLSSSISVAVYEDELREFTFFLLKDENDVGWVDIYDPVPGNGAVDQNISFTMQWQIDQQYPTKELVYTVYYFESNSTTQLVAGENLNQTEVVIDGLEYYKTYYWYVLAKYEGKDVANSPTWSFKTEIETVESK
jgi:hypothetical protein